jgi:hypothetical protein
MIVFPMAGLSRRFSEAGYTLPKYMLPLAGGTCFDFSVSGFLGPYRSETFVFVMRDVQETPQFVEERLRALGVGDYRLVVLAGPTSGQGETVEKGLEGLAAGDEELTVFNIDTFRMNVSRPTPEERGDGHLEVFRGSGDGWSFVEPTPNGSGKVARTTEKVPISDLCCTGLYSFARVSDFREALEAERRSPTSALGETYIAPIYNHLIGRGREIRYSLIRNDDVVFCGVPAEYEALASNPAPLKALSRPEG